MDGKSDRSDDGPSRESLVADLERVAAKLDSVPIEADMREHGQYPVADYLSTFERWDRALDAAEVSPDREDVLRELRRVRAELGRKPSFGEFRTRSYVREHHYEEYFDSWLTFRNAIDEVPTEAEVRTEIRRLESTLGRVPTPDEFEAQSVHRRGDWQQHFDSWKAALNAAGVPPDRSEVIGEIRRLTDELGRTPTIAEFDERATVPKRYYQEYFGTWIDALEAADVLPTREEVLAEIERVTETMGHVPKASEFTERSHVRQVEYLHYYDSWSDAVEAAEQLPTDDDLIEAVNWAAWSMARVPTEAELREDADLRPEDPLAGFETYRDLLEATDVLPTTTDLVEAAQTAAEERDEEAVPPVGDVLERVGLDEVGLLPHFDSYDGLLAAAGLGPDENDVLKTVRQLEADHGRPPTEAELRDRLGLDDREGVPHFDSVDSALAAAGVESTEVDVLEAIRQVNDELGRPPTVREVEVRTDLADADWQRRFDSWNDALAVAEVLPEREELLDDLRRAEEVFGTDVLLDEDPSGTGFRRPHYRHCFETWEAALNAAGVLDGEAPDADGDTDADTPTRSDDDGTADTDGRVDDGPEDPDDDARTDSVAAGVEAVTGNRGDTEPPTRGDLVAAIRDLIRETGSVPTVQDVLTETPFDSAAYRHHFDSTRRAISVAIDDEEVAKAVVESAVPATTRDRLTEVAADLGRPPSKAYVETHTDLQFDAVPKEFVDWSRILDVVGLDPADVDPAAELVGEIERLAVQLGHRPNHDELRAYIPDERVPDESEGSLNEALAAADVPDERDMTPTHSLTRQRFDESTDDVPSHTDLLAELNVVRARASGLPLAEAFEERGVIGEHHYDIQFGGLNEAIAALEGIDTRTFREPTRRIESVPGPIIADYVAELTDILGRPPLVEEVIHFGDATVDDVLDAFDTWDEVVDTTVPDDTWSNEDLLAEIESVGQELGRPPMLTEMTEVGSVPWPCYPRRFGSWSTALAHVGVDVSDVPEEYHALDLTARLWELTDLLVEEAFAHEVALRDELYRLQFELGRRPTPEDVCQYSPYPIAPFERAFGSVADATASMESATVVTRTERGTRGERGTATDTTPADDRLLAGLPEVSDRRDGLRWLLPLDLCLSGDYTAGTYIGAFGSLEAALEAAGVETAHLAWPTDTYAGAWHPDHWSKRDILRSIRRVAKKTGEAPTVDRICAIDGITQPIVYRHFERWDDALAAAGVRAASPLDDRPEDIGRETGEGEPDNPDFVDDLLSDLSDMMDDGE
jgi:hypothetical protein